MDHDHKNLSDFFLTILAASVLSKCSRTALYDRDVDQRLPWESTSDFAAANSLLPLLEFRLFGKGQAADGANDQETEPERPQLSEHFIFAQTLFHLCHCLLNHPFLLRMRLKKLGLNAPPRTFLTRAFRNGLNNACRLIDTIQNAREARIRVNTSFYGYCASLAGSIIILHLDVRTGVNLDRDFDLNYACEQSFGFLQHLEPRWDHAYSIVSAIICSLRSTD